MGIEISPKEITEHIERVLSLLKNQNYIPLATVLVTQERDKLYNLLFSYDEYGGGKSKFGDYYRLKTQEDVDNLNKEVLKNMDGETYAIIMKCGVDPNKVFSFNGGRCDIDEQLFDSMSAHSVTRIGEYTIDFSREHPIDRNSAVIKSFCEEFQQEKFDRYKDGEASFRVFRETSGNGTPQVVYSHREGMKFGGYIGFMGHQIGGNFGMAGFRFSGSAVMMKMDEGIANSINDLMPFFYSFENLLEKEIINGLPSPVKSVDLNSPQHGK